MPENRTNLELTIEKLVYGGEGLARIDGRVALAPFVLPGEKIEAEIKRERPGLLRARVLQVLQPHAGRVLAPCPYFGRCGGCDYQHAPYEMQLDIKKSVLMETLERVGKFSPPESIEEVVSGEPWNYRNRSQFHLHEGQIGYLEARSHELCAIEYCPISSPRLNEIIATIRGMLRDPRWPRFVRSLEVFTNERDVQINVLETERPVALRFFEWCAERIPGLAAGSIEYAAAGATFRVSGRSFFQVNRFLIDRLVETALAGADGETALDLYAGVGLFSIPLARKFARVTAVESSASALEDLEWNAAKAAVRVSAQRSAVELFLENVKAPPDFVVLDPPRAGIGPRVVKRLLDLKPPRVTIVSCDPATLARDLAGLLAGGYRIEQLTLVDLFPQTFHMETVARLKVEHPRSNQG